MVRGREPPPTAEFAVRYPPVGTASTVLQEFEHGNRGSANGQRGSASAGGGLPLAAGCGHLSGSASQVRWRMIALPAVARDEWDVLPCAVGCWSAPVARTRSEVRRAVQRGAEELRNDTKGAAAAYNRWS